MPGTAYVTQEKVQLKGNLAEFRQALEDEIEEIKKSGQSSTMLKNGRMVVSSGAGFWYRFSVEYLPIMPADTPCTLIVGNEQYDVTVVSFEDNSIVLASMTQLPESIGKARLENGSTVLMERLIKRIQSNAEKANPAGDRLLGTPESAEPARYSRVAVCDDIVLSPGNTESQN